MINKVSIALLFFLFSSMANAGTNIGSNTVWRGTKIEVSGPSASFDLQALIDNIADAGAVKPYLILLGPGVYTLTDTVEMEEWVSISGSGQHVTTLTGAISGSTILYANSAIILGANNAALSDLKVENTGGSSYSIGIYNHGASPRLERVNFVASGATERNYAVYNNAASSPVMHDVDATASGGAGNYGVYNKASSLVKMTNVSASASSGSDYNRAVYNYTSSVAIIDHSVLSATGTESVGLYVESAATRVTNTKITGAINGDVAGTQCRDTYNEDLNDVSC